MHLQPACYGPLRGAATTVPLPRALPHSPPGSSTQGAVVGAHGPAGVGSTDRSEGSGFTGVAQGPCVTSSAPRHGHEDTKTAAAAASRALGEVSWEDPQGARLAFCRVSVQGQAHPPTPHCLLSGSQAHQPPQPQAAQVCMTSHLQLRGAGSRPHLALGDRILEVGAWELHL